VNIFKVEFFLLKRG